MQVKSRAGKLCEEELHMNARRIVSLQPCNFIGQMQFHGLTMISFSS